MAEEPPEQRLVTRSVGVGRVGDSAADVSQRRLRADAAEATLTA